MTNEQQWVKVTAWVEKQFNLGPAMEEILFLIGIQELGKGYQNFSREEKMDLIHLGMCAVLTPLGYFKALEREDKEWPRFERNKEKSFPTGQAQTILLKEGIIQYMLPIMEE